MKKSEIVIEVMSRRAGTSLPEKKILNQLLSALRQRSLEFEHWDDYLDSELVGSIMRNVLGVKGTLPIQGLIQDIDILVRRSRG